MSGSPYPSHGRRVAGNWGTESLQSPTLHRSTCIRKRHCASYAKALYESFSTLCGTKGRFSRLKYKEGKERRYLLVDR